MKTEEPKVFGRACITSEQIRGPLCLFNCPAKCLTPTQLPGENTTCAEQPCSVWLRKAHRPGSRIFGGLTLTGPRARFAAGRNNKLHLVCRSKRNRSPCEPGGTQLRSPTVLCVSYYQLADQQQT